MYPGFLVICSQLVLCAAQNSQCLCIEWESPNNWPMRVFLEQVFSQLDFVVRHKWIYIRNSKSNIRGPGWRLLKTFFWLPLGFEGSSAHDERKERKSDFENSEDDKRTRIGSLKKKAINASSKFRHSLNLKSRKKSSSRTNSVSIEDFRNVEEQKAVDEFKQALILDDLLPTRHDDYHMLLRWTPFLLLLFRMNYVIHGLHGFRIS
jgi:hypothetical protein